GDELHLQRLASTGGGEIGGFDAKLRYGIEVRNDHAAFGTGIVVILAVDGEKCLVSAHAEALHSSGVRVAAEAQISHARHQADHLNRIAPVERQLADLRLFHTAGDTGLLCLHELNASLDGDLLLGGADLQDGGDALVLLSSELDVL